MQLHSHSAWRVISVTVGVAIPYNTCIVSNQLSYKTIRIEGHIYLQVTFYQYLRTTITVKFTRVLDETKHKK
jgi:hypothetical protein